MIQFRDLLFSLSTGKETESSIIYVQASKICHSQRGKAVIYGSHSQSTDIEFKNFLKLIVNRT